MSEFVPKTTQEKEAHRKFLLLGELAGRAKSNEVLKDYDDKTGLLHYKPFVTQVDKIRGSEASRVRGSKGVLVIADIDDFKTLNSRVGHDVVDKKYLIPTAHLIDSVARRHTDAKSSRFGGEEFVVYLDGTNVEDARAIAKKLRGEVNELGIGISMGISEYGPDTTYDDAFHAANKALMIAKDVPQKNEILVWNDLPSQAAEA